VENSILNIFPLNVTVITSSYVYMSCKKNKRDTEEESGTAGSIGVGKINDGCA